MKRITFSVILISLYGISVLAQEIKPEQVPSTVISSFNKQFPSAKDVEWEMDEAKIEVEFTMSHVEWSAKFDQNGNLLETEQEIKVTQLPEIVRQNIEKTYPGSKIKEAEQIIIDKNVILYEVELKSGKKTFEVQISSDGKTLKSSEMNKSSKD